MANFIDEVKVVEVYADDDPEYEGDAYSKTLYVNGKEVLTGDWYHDKISAKIKGYVACLWDLGMFRSEPNVEKYTEKIWTKKTKKMKVKTENPTKMNKD